MSRFPLDKFAPDAAGFDQPALALARNVLPLDDGYGPMRSLDLGSAAAITGEVRGAIEYEYDGDTEVFVGTATKLWRKNGDTWTDVTRTVGGDYTLGELDSWTFESFGSYIIACNGVDVVQKFDLSVDTDFEALAGTPPLGVGMCEHKDILFFWEDTADGQSSVEWSGINNPEIYDGTLLSDVQPISSGGPGRAIINAGDCVFYFQDRKVHRFVYNSNPETVFTRDEVEVGRGCVGRKAVAADAGSVFYLAHDGFYSMSASLAVESIGSGFVNEFFAARCAVADRGLTLAVADPGATRIFFLYRSVNVGDTPYDEALIYDWRLKKWSFASLPMQWLFATSSPAWTLADLEAVYGLLSNVPEPLSSRRWKAGSDVLGGFDGSGFLGTLTGSTMEALFETSTMLEPETVKKLAGSVKGIINTGSWSSSIGTVQDTDEEPVWTGYEAKNVAGWARHRVAGKGIRIRLKVSAGATWTKAQAISFEVQPPYAPRR